MTEININGKKLPIHFGLRALNEFSKESNIEFKNVVGSSDVTRSLETIPSLLMTSLNEGARRSNIENRYTIDDAIDMIDDDPSLLTTTVDKFTEAIAPFIEKLGLKPKNEVHPAVEKKK